MLVELSDSINKKPIAVNPDQVVYVTPEPTESKKTRITLVSGEKGHIIVDGNFAEVLAKLNGKKTTKTKVGAL